MSRARNHIPRIGAALGAVLAATSVAFAPLSPPAASAADDQRQLSVLTHNVMMLPPIAGSFANGTRAKLIAEADYVRGHDVVIFQEAFENGPADDLKSRLSVQYPYQTPVMGRTSTSGWDDTRGEFWWFAPEDGGVTVLSKWPITRKVQHVYTDGCGWDAASNKGFVYARLDVDGKPVHVVGTHAQADDTGCSDAASVRATQFRELDGFLDGLAIPSDQQVIIGGDLNVVRDSPEYASMLATLDVVPPTGYLGAPYSFDPQTNSATAVRYPGSAQEHLDYVLYRRGNQGPTMSNTTLTPVAPPYQFGGATHDDYSDHYPVVSVR